MFRLTRRAFWILFPIVAAAVACWWVYDPIDRAYGNFEGAVTATWDDDGRNMTLEREFAYVDPHGKRWIAPSGSVINGASILAHVLVGNRRSV